MKKHKILFHIHNLSRGGAERVVVTLAEKFVAEGIETLIVTEETAESEYELPDGVRRMNASENVHSDESTSLFGRMRNLRKRQQDLRRVLLSEKPEVVIAFDRSANYRAVAAAKGICPVIVSVRNDPAKDYVGRMQQYFCKKYMYKANGCVFQTQQAKEFFPVAFQNRSCIIMNPLNEKYRNVAVTGERRRTVVTAGRITSQKNQLLLLDAFAMMRQMESCKDVQLLIYGADSGDGTLEKLEQRTKDLGCEEKVVFMGNRTNLETELPGAGVFVLSSDYEGMPNALMEAMAMGIPCVSTDCPCGGPQMLIENGVNGVLVPVRDVQALADAMQKILSDTLYGDQLSQNALKIWDEANVNNIYMKWKEYIQKILIWREDS